MVCSYESQGIGHIPNDILEIFVMVHVHMISIFFI